MKNALRLFAVCLLLINGTGALYGGYELIAVPDGSSMQMPLSMLQYSPFHDFSIPGLILFVANGVYSLVVLAMVLFKYKHSAANVLVQGVILTFWIVIQVLMLHSFVLLHFIFISIGFLLVVAGISMLKAASADGRTE